MYGWHRMLSLHHHRWHRFQPSHKHPDVSSGKQQPVYGLYNHPLMYRWSVPYPDALQHLCHKHNSGKILQTYLRYNHWTSQESVRHLSESDTLRCHLGKPGMTYCHPQSVRMYPYPDRMYRYPLYRNNKSYVHPSDNLRSWHCPWR